MQEYAYDQASQVPKQASSCFPSSGLSFRSSFQVTPEASDLRFSCCTSFSIASSLSRMAW